MRLEREGGSQQLVKQSGGIFHEAAALHFSQFLAAIKSGVEPAVSARHAREIIRIMSAGYQSAAEGGKLVELHRNAQKEQVV